MNTKRKTSRSPQHRDALQALSKVCSAPTFGELVKSLRITDEVSQTDLARKLGITKQHLSAIEKGSKAVSVARAAKFAETLGYPVQQFVIAVLQDELNAAGVDLTFDIRKIIND